MSCIFCQIAAKEIPSELIYEDDRLIAFHDIQPQAPVHFLVLPKKHITRLADMDINDFQLIGKMSQVATDLAKEAGISDGFRIAVNCGEQGGQTVWHVHMHVLGGRQLNGYLG